MFSSFAQYLSDLFGLLLSCHRRHMQASKWFVFHGHDTGVVVLMPVGQDSSSDSERLKSSLTSSLLGLMLSVSHVLLGLDPFVLIS